MQIKTKTWCHASAIAWTEQNQKAEGEGVGEHWRRARAMDPGLPVQETALLSDKLLESSQAFSA